MLAQMLERPAGPSPILPHFLGLFGELLWLASCWPEQPQRVAEHYSLPELFLCLRGRSPLRLLSALTHEQNSQWLPPGQEAPLPGEVKQRNQVFAAYCPPIIRPWLVERRERAGWAG
jgi:hypothetical protein